MGLHQNEGVGQTFRAGAVSMDQWLLIEPDGNFASDGTPTAVLVGVTPAGLGPIMQNAKPASVVGDPVTGVRLCHYSTYNLVADGVIAAGAKVYTAAGGQVGTTATSATEIGIALTATDTAGQYVTVMPNGTAA